MIGVLTRRTSGICLTSEKMGVQCSNQKDRRMRPERMPPKVSENCPKMEPLKTQKETTKTRSTNIGGALTPSPSPYIPMGGLKKTKEPPMLNNIKLYNVWNT